jgi:hypothetical protein
MRGQIFPFSSIRTVTVGFGIAPNLLTPPIARRALAGFGDRSPLPPVGTFTPPRERGRTEIRPVRLKLVWSSHTTIFANRTVSLPRSSETENTALLLRHEQQHDAADRASDAGDQLGTHIFLPEERAAQQQGHQRVAGDER